jgi:hypothetical protein
VKMAPLSVITEGRCAPVGEGAAEGGHHIRAADAAPRHSGDHQPRVVVKDVEDPGHSKMNGCSGAAAPPPVRRAQGVTRAAGACGDIVGGGAERPGAGGCRWHQSGLENRVPPNSDRY